MKCYVLRTFTARGVEYHKDDLIDVDDWPDANVKAMISQHMIKQALVPIDSVGDADLDTEPPRRGPGRPKKEE